MTKQTVPLLSGLLAFASFVVGITAIFTAFLLPLSLIMLLNIGWTDWWPLGFLLGLAGLPGCAIVALAILND